MGTNHVQDMCWVLCL